MGREGAGVMKSRELIRLSLPLTTEVVAHVDAPFPVSEYEWARLMEVLNACKPGLVDPAEAVTRSTDWGGIPGDPDAWGAKPAPTLESPSPTATTSGAAP